MPCASWKASDILQRRWRGEGDMAVGEVCGKLCWVGDELGEHVDKVTEGEPWGTLGSVSAGQV